MCFQFPGFDGSGQDTLLCIYPPSLSGLRCFCLSIPWGLDSTFRPGLQLGFCFCTGSTLRHWSRRFVSVLTYCFPFPYTYIYRTGPWGEHPFLFSLEKRLGGRDRQQRGGGYYKATNGKRTTSEGKTRLVLVFFFSFRFLYPMSRGGGEGERIGTAPIEERSTCWHRKRRKIQARDQHMARMETWADGMDGWPFPPFYLPSIAAIAIRYLAAVVGRRRRQPRQHQHQQINAKSQMPLERVCRRIKLKIKVQILVNAWSDSDGKPPELQLQHSDPGTSPVEPLPKRTPLP
ncbi:hypothetical protein B0T18DRAFT_87890 [Schizothecium vesticola]|uniref:Uncharacterized protein n=1 Tax=Schizothecium vesticola TaxID=314040 RepID=A0AA40KAS2_9PEZI|nr:hypothetical protein B0T18DRAFT_87890 [Schizothecium vesticola]